MRGHACKWMLRARLPEIRENLFYSRLLLCGRGFFRRTEIAAPFQIKQERGLGRRATAPPPRSVMKSRRLSRSNRIYPLKPDWQHSGLARIKSGHATLRCFHPANDRLGSGHAAVRGFRASPVANVRDRRARRYVRLVNGSLLTERSLRRIKYFLEILISEDKDNYYGCVHCNDEPKQNPSLSTQPLYFIAGLSESL